MTDLTTPSTAAPPGTTGPGTAPGHPRRRAALAVLLAAEAMNLLDATVVHVAAPVIHASLGGPLGTVQWFSAAYTLPFAVLLITGGRLADAVGRRRVFRLGVAGFALASVLCALAPTAGALIAARAAQGAAAAAVIPQTVGLIRAMFRGPEAGRALGTIGPVMGLAAVCGPVLGGLLTHADLLGTSWRAVFLVNVPPSVAVLLGSRLLPEDRAPRPPRPDVLGTVLAALGTGLVVHPLIEADAAGPRPRTWASLAAGLAVLTAFGAQQRRRARAGRSPLVEPGLFRGRSFPAALLTSALFFSVTTGLMMVAVLHLQLGPGTGTLTAGLTVLPWSVGLAVSSWLAGARLVPRYGPRLMFAGLALAAAGTLAAAAVYHLAPPAAYPWPLLGAFAVMGLGFGTFTVPYFSAALANVRPQETGSAAGLLNSVQQLGGTLGVALLGTLFLHTRHDTPSATPAAARLAFAAGGGLIAVTAVAALTMTAGRGRERA
ncbi:MFS transporter [Streptomyces huiliensis]|uniref:MFS transporter n=1 Tax=Streptomyces huiliensis TaxID=2876027 RepID=UPI001CBE2892|nr:MFS transporter [Streptomyces huiliensis]